MRKAQLKSILMMALFVLCLGIIFVSSTDIEKHTPVNSILTVESWQNSTTVNFNFTAYANESTTLEWCAIFSNETGTYKKTANYTNDVVKNGTPFIRGLDFSDLRDIIYDIKCFNGTDGDTGESFSAEGNRTFSVDGTRTTITLENPADNTFTNENTINLTFTPIDASFLDGCNLYANFSGSWVSNESFDAPVSNEKAGLNLSGIVDGEYIWNVQCNETNERKTWAEDTNRTITIDTVLPADIKFVTINNTVTTDTTPLIQWNQSADDYFKEYNVQVATDVNFTIVIQTAITTSVTSNSTTLTQLTTDDQYFVMVTAEDQAGNEKNATTILYLAIDTTTPVITLVSPQNGTASNDNTQNFTMSVADNNPDNCILFLSNHTMGAIRENKTLDIGNISSGTIFNITTEAMADGNFTFNIECNDSVGLVSNVSATDLDLVIDTANPTQPNITSAWHQTNSTDTTPVLTWLESTDNNFDKYVVEPKYFENDSVVYQINVSPSSTNFAELTALSTDLLYNFTVTAYDTAGNTAVSVNTSTSTWYYVDSICGVLSVGWNMCGGVSITPRNLSVIGAETGASFVSVYNSTKQFQTCNLISEVSNCNLNMSIDNTNFHSVFVYVNATTQWDNRTWSALRTSANITLTNLTTNGWNLIGSYFRNGRTFEQFNTSRFTENNVTMYSKPFNNGSLNIPFVARAGWNSINKGTRVEYGEALWVFSNASHTNNVFDVGAW